MVFTYWMDIYSGVLIMTNYTRGVRLEREVQDIFRKAGWEAIRTAGSHSPFDVILVKYTDATQGKSKGFSKNRKVCFVSFVQCKVEKCTKVDNSIDFVKKFDV